jgi:hypothetical protein
MFPIIFALVTLTLPVTARDTGQWENQPIYLRQWFQKLMQPDNPDMSCYGEADAASRHRFFGPSISSSAMFSTLPFLREAVSAQEAGAECEPEQCTETGDQSPLRL